VVGQFVRAAGQLALLTQIRVIGILIHGSRMHFKTVAFMCVCDAKNARNSCPAGQVGQTPIPIFTGCNFTHVSGGGTHRILAESIGHCQKALWTSSAEQREIERERERERKREKERDRI
jgi:hypothetical protein